MRLWIDTDVGGDPDDAIALLCAAAHPAVDLVGVSTVDGDHERRVGVARSLVEAPVHRGDDPRLAQTPHPGGILVGLADGSVRGVAASVAGATWWAACTPAGGEALGGGWNEP